LSPVPVALYATDISWSPGGPRVGAFAGGLPEEEIMMRMVLAVLALLAAATVLAPSPATARIFSNTIGLTADLTVHGHAARGTVLLECTAGQTVRLTLTLTQGGAHGTGHGFGLCTGELTAYEVTVWARGGRFTPGTAEACATAVNRQRGHVVDTREWCRAASVTLSGP
jgi:hypothetical protein